MCDNIVLDAEGRAWMGCHPKGFTFLLHGKHILDKAPSHVRHGRGPAVSAVFRLSPFPDPCLPAHLHTDAPASVRLRLRQVLVLDPSQPVGQGRLLEPLLSDGSDLPGSSVAAPWGNLFLVGSVRGDGLLVCEMQSASEWHA